jgi:hypothetical protein
MSIIRSKLIALDSAHLGALAADWSSSDKSRRRRATSFLEALSGCGGVLVLSWHHIEELLLHDDETVVAKRVAFLRSLPMVASVTSLGNDDVPGGIVHITACEIIAALESPNSDAEAVRDSVAPHLLHLLTGRRAIAPFMIDWIQLKPLLRERQARNRDIVAIGLSDFAGIGETKVSDWLKGSLRSPEDIERQLGMLHHKLSGDITRRGDKRIADPGASSMGFFEDVIQTAAEALREGSSPATQFLKSLNVDVAEVGSGMTVAELGELAVFRQRLKHFSQILDIPFDVLKKRVRESQLPSHLIQSALRRYRQDTAEWKGSELNDRAWPVWRRTPISLLSIEECLKA